MIQSNRYLVVWVSSVSGKHHEAFETSERAEKRLDGVEQRAFFEHGVVIDTLAAGIQRSPEEFRHIHESHPGLANPASSGVRG